MGTLPGWNPAKQLTLMGKFKWERQLHALPLDRSVKDVGYALARFASDDGKDARPGVMRIMWASGIKDERTVHKALAELLRLGLIYRYKRGGGRPSPRKAPLADEYWLTTHEQADGWVTDFETWLKGYRSALLPPPGACRFRPETTRTGCQEFGKLPPSGAGNYLHSLQNYWHLVRRNYLHRVGVHQSLSPVISINQSPLPSPQGEAPRFASSVRHAIQQQQEARRLAEVTSGSGDEFR